MCFISVLRVIEGMGELLPDFSPPIALSRVTNTLLDHDSVFIIEHNFLTPYEKILLNT